MAFFNQYPYLNENDLNLDYLLKHIKELMARVSGLEEWRLTHEAEYAQLKALYDQIISGNFPPSVTAAFKKWLQENALDLIGELVKMVFFGITDEGYFVAYIPESWEDIIFGTTGLDDFPSGVDYGHLTLSYEIGG